MSCQVHKFGFAWRCVPVSSFLSVLLWIYFHKLEIYAFSVFAWFSANIKNKFTVVHLHHRLPPSLALLLVYGYRKFPPCACIFVSVFKIYLFIYFCCLQMLSHRLFPHAKYSIWVDSKSQFRRDPLGVLEALLWRSNSVLAISEHGARSSVYDEAKAVVNKHKATPEEVEVQLTQYRHDGFPEDKRFNGKKGVFLFVVFVLTGPHHNQHTIF